MNIIIFGSPGAGKGTQSNYIVFKYKLFQLSTGDILRKEMEKKSQLGRRISKSMDSGNLVSDEIVGKLVENIISNKEYKNRIVFDGYPRNLKQAKELEKLLTNHKQKINLVLNLKVKLETIKKRIIGRYICYKCGKIYNEFFNPAPKNGNCCSEKFLQKRKDDNVDVVIKRFETYKKDTEPVLNFYNKLKLLKEVNGENSIDRICKEISDIMALI